MSPGKKPRAKRQPPPPTPKAPKPWDIAIAPSDFGAFSNDVLIGNFNDDNVSEAFISAYDMTGEYVGELTRRAGDAKRDAAVQFAARLSKPGDMSVIPI